MKFMIIVGIKSIKQGVISIIINNGLYINYESENKDFHRLEKEKCLSHLDWWRQNHNKL